MSKVCRESGSDNPQKSFEIFLGPSADLENDSENGSAAQRLTIITGVEVELCHLRGVRLAVFLAKAEDNDRSVVAFHDHLDNLETARLTCKHHTLDTHYCPLLKTVLCCNTTTAPP